APYDHGRRGDADEKHRRREYLNPRPARRNRIEDREAHRPQRLADIAAVGHERVRQPRRKWKDVERRYRARVRRHDERQRAHRRCEHEERQLLGDERRGLRRARAIERPPVEEKKYEGQRDDHRLGQEPGRESDGDDGQPPPTRPPRVARISPERHERGARAEEVLDSTCRGWRANTAATSVLRQSAPVSARSARRRSNVLPEWKATLT